MKKNFKKLVSFAAVLTLSATAALSAIPFSACTNGDESAAKEPDKLITPDGNHSAHYVSTALGTVRTETSGKKYYVAPDGAISNDGSSWETPTTLAFLLGDETNSPLKAGDTVYVKPGTYKQTSTITSKLSGTYQKYIRVVNAALEKAESGYSGEETVCTLDFSAQSFASTSRGVQLYGNYVYWYGIDVCGAGDNGLYIGGSYNTVEYCEFYNNRDTGLQLGRAESGLNSIEQWPNYNLVKNCTSHNNYDNETYGENADGFAAKLTVGYGNVFDGCIAYRNSDDGWDLYAKADSGNIGCVIIYNCVAFENGYLEYTQKENNARYPTFNKDYEETFDTDDVRYFRTRDGDGNGFKLGGSVMEGDVVMYNCLSYGNRMHGVTDNSNPGYLKIEGVTSFDNSAVVDENKDSPTFGQIIGGNVSYKQDTHGNIDVARQVYSYNSVIDVLSVKTSDAKYLDPDAYRGSVTDSILLGKNVQNVIKGSIDADTKYENVASLNYTETKALLNPTDVFVKLPYTTAAVDDGNGGTTTQYTYNLSGLRDLYSDNTETSLNADRVHNVYRNADGSINMGEILAKKDGIDNSALISGKNLGSTLNKASWANYTHFYEKDVVNGDAASEDLAKIERMYETLTINTDLNAVYQDFEVPLMMKECTITWQSSDTNTVKAKTVTGANGNEEIYVENSISGSKYGTMLVYRPDSEDAHVTLTATISCGTQTRTKEFELTIKAGIPTIGEIYVVTQNGDKITNGSSYVADQYSILTEPEIRVENGLDYNGKLLTSAQYTYETKYMYSAIKGGAAIEIADFTPSNAGVYTITHKVTLKADTSKSASMTYTIYVSSVNAQVDFLTREVAVNRDGFTINGTLNNATGYIYAVGTSSTTAPTAETIKTYEGVQIFEFRGDSISFQFKNDNSGAYTVYYALVNLNGNVTTQIYSQEISALSIDSEAKFMTVAQGGKLGTENPATTIYQLTKDLDFSQTTWTVPKSKTDFVGLLNGMGHKVSNVTIKGTRDTVGIFDSVKGATIENIKFDNIDIYSSGKQVGLIGTSYGGYFHNIAMTNIKVEAKDQRVGGLIGQTFESVMGTYISQVSLINENPKKGEEYAYYIKSGSQRVGGIIGLVQTSSSPVNGLRVYISNCYVDAIVYSAQAVGGFVGQYDNAKEGTEYMLDISSCVFAGVGVSTYATPRLGGILGYQSSNVGSFVISNCLSFGELYYSADHVKLVQSLKTCSLIVGGFASAAVNTVKNCAATIEEYNADYDVVVFSTRNLERNKDGVKDIIGEDFDEHWTFVISTENPNYLMAPYVALKFL